MFAHSESLELWSSDILPPAYFAYAAHVTYLTITTHKVVHRELEIWPTFFAVSAAMFHCQCLAHCSACLQSLRGNKQWLFEHPN
jgi:hypothetical protein